MTEHTEDRSYIAFISYRHKELDREAAVALQKKIEHFKIPKELQAETGKDRLGYVFRDEDELPTSSSLSDSIRYALDHTEFLIVICTPDLPASEWCAEEIRYFLSTHDRDHLLAVLANGEPEESFSPYMTNVYDENGDVLRRVEPLAANIVGTPEHYSRPKFKKESIRIIAALLGCPFDELWQRERRYQNRRRLIFGGAAFAAMAVFAIVVGAKNLQISAKNAEITAQNNQIIEQNEQITRQNSEITEKNQELQVREGKLLKEAGDLLLEGHDLSGAAENARQALQIENVHTEGAELLMANAVGAYSAESLRIDLAAEQASSIARCIAASDGSITFTSDRYGVVRALSEDKELWSFSSVPSEARSEYLRSGCSTDLYLVENESILLIGNAWYVAGLSPKTGAILWDLEKKYAVNFLAVSPDGTKFAVFNDFSTKDCLSIRSTKNGLTLFWFYLPTFQFKYKGMEMDYVYDLSYYASGINFGGCFSADGKYLMFGANLPLSTYDLLNKDAETWISENWDTQAEITELLDNEAGKGSDSSESDSSGSDLSDRKDLMVYSIVDMEEQSIRMVGTEPIHTGMNPVFGLHYNDETDELFFIRHDDKDRSTYAGLIDKDGNVRYTLQRSDIKLYNTSVPWSYQEGNQTIAASSANNLYLFDKATGEFTGRYERDRNLIGCDWVDWENDVLMTVLEDGTYDVYPLLLDENTQYLSTGEGFPVNNLARAVKSGDGIFRWDSENHRLLSADGSWLLLSADADSKVMAADIYTDPNANELSDAVFERMCYVFQSADGSELYLLKRGRDSLLLNLLDPASGKILAKNTFENLSFIPDHPFAILPGGESILYGNQLYRADGSIDYLEITTAEESDIFASSAVVSQTADGTVLTVWPLRTNGEDKFIVWKNETGYCTYTTDDEKSMLISDETDNYGKPGETILLKAGKNGAVVVGICAPKARQYTGYAVVPTDSLEEEYFVQSVSSARPYSLLCPANESLLFAVLEDDGVLRVYDPAKNAAVLEITDANLFAGAIGLAFAGHDRYLGVLNYSGEFSLYDVSSGRQILKDTNSNLANDYGEYVMELTLSADETRLICMVTEIHWRDRNNGAVYDLSTGERVADIPNLVAYSPVSDQVMIYKTDAKLAKFFLCPLYNAQTLLQ